MKLQISYDFIDIVDALSVAKLTADYADIMEIGASLLYAHGIQAIKAFRDQFPDKELFADTKIIDKITRTIPLFASSGANSLSILAGADNKAIAQAVSQARTNNLKVMIDLIDSSSPGQSALDAQGFEVDAIIFRRPTEIENSIDLIDAWQNVRGNTSLPIFIGGNITLENLPEIVELEPHGIIVGSDITRAENPQEQAQKIRDFILSKRKNSE